MFRSYDDWKMTEPPTDETPTPCTQCGHHTDDAELTIDGTRYRVCADCQANGYVGQCHDCGTLHWADDLIRLFATPNLYCTTCAQTYPFYHEDLARAARADEDRDNP
ncbi:MAG: hypothetical protein EBS37_17350 [Betaproteobacteria bacterium]|nr:hypothetical protein [Betaproteobacteria bacterium]